jgi:hypothetical protein
LKRSYGERSRPADSRSKGHLLSGEKRQKVKQFRKNCRMKNSVLTC